MQLANFRQLSDDQGKPLMSRNVRSTQHEHDRIVIFSGAPPGACGACAGGGNRRTDRSTLKNQKEIIKPNKRRD